MTPRFWRPAGVAGLTAALTMAAGAPEALAQYFGGNKVRYESPEFHVLKTDHFDIYSYAEEDAYARDAAVMIERWRGRLTTALNHNLSGRQPLILYAGHPHFRQTNATPGEIGEGTGGFTEMFKRRIVLPLAGVPHETDHVLGHELVHAFQFDVLRKVQQANRGRGASINLPLWFIEGMAEYFSIGSADPQTALWMRDAVVNDDLPTIAKLGNPKYFPYRYGHAFWAYVGGRFGDAAVSRLLRTATRTGDVRRALRMDLGVDHEQLSKDWHAELKAEYEPVLAAAKPTTDFGRVLIQTSEEKVGYNLSPSLSPDGKRMLFFSERDLYSIELYVLDVESGKVLRRLTKSVTDPHIDSLQFLSSAGTWSPDGKRVAIGGVGSGRPVLTILDPETGETVAEHRLPELVEVMHPAWSPDGKRIAFAGNKGGVMQLHEFDFATGTARVLVPGPYAALQPAWSPDGRRIVFVTDRFTSDAQKLNFGDYRLAQLELATGAVTPLPGFAVGKNTNPQFSPDGKQLYFLSDAQGGPNLYRLDLASRTVEGLTDLKTGISGITRLSPAMSVATQAPGVVAASVFNKGMYAIYLLDKPQPRAVALAADPAAPALGQLPPRERYLPIIDAQLAQAKPAADAITIEGPKDYDADLGVDTVGQVGAVVGTSDAGAFIGGGLALQWSDMLGDHNLVTLAELEGDATTWDRNVSLLVDYENREQRLRWGAGVSQYSTFAFGYTLEFGTFEGEGAARERLIRQWQINRTVAGHVAYPLTRNDRVEGTFGYRNISFVTDALESIYAVNNGQLLASGISDLPSPPSLDLYPLGVAYVHDSTLWGGTAPVSGRRYRLELATLLGDVSYQSPLLDFRQYYDPFRYLSFGGRLLYYGRYGSGAEDPRIGDVFLGSWTLVRGYDAGTFSALECNGGTATPECPVYDQLFGSHIAITSVEARMPVFGARGIVATPSVPPIDVAAFYDAGVAWTSDEKAYFLGGPRDLIRSYGATLRVSFFGALVLQWNYVKPIDRPLQDWYWQFLIAPGF